MLIGGRLVGKIVYVANGGYKDKIVSGRNAEMKVWAIELGMLGELHRTDQRLITIKNFQWLYAIMQYSLDLFK